MGEPILEWRAHSPHSVPLPLPLPCPRCMTLAPSPQTCTQSRNMGTVSWCHWDIWGLVWQENQNDSGDYLVLK